MSGLRLAGLLLGIAGGGLGLLVPVFLAIARDEPLAFYGPAAAAGYALAEALTLVASIGAVMGAIASLRWPLASSLTMFVCSIGVAIPFQILGVDESIIAFLPAGIIVIAGYLAYSAPPHQDQHRRLELVPLAVQLAFLGIAAGFFIQVYSVNARGPSRIDCSSGSVRKFTGDGKVLATWEACGIDPSGITTDVTGKVYQRRWQLRSKGVQR